MRQVYILGGLRSYIGLCNGMYRHIPAEFLGAKVLKNLKEKYKIEDKDIDYIIAGNGVGAGGNITRLMTLKAGIDENVPAFTVDMQCCSGLESIAVAYAKIASGQADMIIAGGFESSSTQPIRGYNKNHPDYTENSFYTVAKFIPNNHRETIMLEGAEYTAIKENITKEELDLWALKSHERAVRARQEHLLDDIVVSINDSDKDEGIRAKMSERLLKRMPKLLLNGEVTTAGNSCLINDGAAFVIVCSEEYLKKIGQKAQARILDYCACGVNPMLSPMGSIKAIKKLLMQKNLDIKNIDCFEVNEAFAVIDVLFERNFPEVIDRYNIFGGALAYGHPYGVSGAMILLHLIKSLEYRKGKLGCCSIAGAGGLGSAMTIEYL